MFYGLNKLIKYILPKRLFYRALIIVAAPTILLQLIITIVFYDSIWIKANKSVTRALVAQLKAVQDVYENGSGEYTGEYALALYQEIYDSSATFVPHVKVTGPSPERVRRPPPADRLG